MPSRVTSRHTAMACPPGSPPSHPHSVQCRRLSPPSPPQATDARGVPRHVAGHDDADARGLLGVQQQRLQQRGTVDERRHVHQTHGAVHLRGRAALPALPCVAQGMADAVDREVDDIVGREKGVGWKVARPGSGLIAGLRATFLPAWRHPLCCSWAAVCRVARRGEGLPAVEGAWPTAPLCWKPVSPGCGAQAQVVVCSLDMLVFDQCCTM
jgi:hypothetical protein